MHINKTYYDNLKTFLKIVLPKDKIRYQITVLIVLEIATHSIATIGITAQSKATLCRNAECRALYIVMLNAVLLSVIIMRVTLLNVVMLTVIKLIVIRLIIIMLNVVC